MSCEFQLAEGGSGVSWFDDLDDVPDPGTDVFYDGRFYRVVGEPLYLIRRSHGFTVAAIEVEPARSPPT